MEVTDISFVAQILQNMAALFIFSNEFDTNMRQSPDLPRHMFARKIDSITFKLRQRVIGYPTSLDVPLAQMANRDF
jgi:hypothetical protein